LTLILYLAIAYMLGGIPFSVIVGRLFYGLDVRKEGSGNAGATNTWRLLGWKAGLSVLVLDAAKGSATAALVPLIPFAKTWVDPPTLALLCGLAAVLGHVFPVYLGFRGGKGVATAAGMLFVVAPLPMACAIGTFAITVVWTGQVSLGSLLGAWVLPLSGILFATWTDVDVSWLLIGLAAALAALITYTHRTNIQRLIRGEERGFPKLQVWKRRTRR